MAFMVGMVSSRDPEKLALADVIEMVVRHLIRE
jgi:hypothetical protein